MATSTSQTVPLEIPRAVNPDLARERNQATLNVEELTHLLDGGAAVTERRRQILKIVCADPVFSVDDKYFETESERYDRAVQKSFRLVKLALEHSWDRSDLTYVASAMRYDFALTLHQAMFIPALERLGTDAQKEKWLPLAYSMRILGTYAQTEMGHGTFLRGLETTATYDPSTQEFVLNTPLPSGMKWWPGALGKSVNHAIVLATLRVRGENAGMQAFITPLRSMTDHTVLPGVELGAIGPRIGLHGADNGYLILRDVRVPRDNMLSRYITIDNSGRLVRHGTAGSEKANYGTMVMVRANIVGWSYESTSMAVTIATRYSAVRHQSELNPREAEPSIINYVTQQHKLFTSLATAYAFFFAKRYILAEYTRIYDTELSSGNFSSMPELHSQSSGLKAYCSDLGMEVIEICRRSCGGHGYLMASGMCDLYGDSLSQVTVEGENTVLYLQVARHLMKQYAAAASGETVCGSTSYLSKPPRACEIQSPSDCNNLTQLQRAFLHRSYWMVQRAARELHNTMERGTVQHNALNTHSVELVRAAKAHIDSFLVCNFVDSVGAVTGVSGNTAGLLRALCALYAGHRASSNSGDFLESGALTTHQLELVRRNMVTLLSQIRPEAVALSDAFDWSDHSLNSCLGAFDGNVYQRLFNWARRAPLNQTEVHESYEKHIKPFQQYLSKL